MELPNPDGVRNDFSKIIEDLDILINFISTKSHLTFFEFYEHLHPINIELVEIWHKINLLGAKDKKYLEAFEDLRRILIKLLIDTGEIEKKHVGKNLLLWESKFQEGKLRKDLVGFFNSIFEQMERIQENF
jgi:hypothetical protein